MSLLRAKPLSSTRVTCKPSPAFADSSAALIAALMLDFPLHGRPDTTMRAIVRCFNEAAEAEHSLSVVYGASEYLEKGGLGLI